MNNKEKSIYITSLDQELIEIKIQNPKRFNLEYLKDEIESLTGIIGPYQFYYYQGKEVQLLDTIENSIEKPLELIENTTLPVIRFLVNYRSRNYPIYVSSYEKKYLLCLKLAIEKKMSSLGIDCPLDAQMLKIDGLELPASLPLSNLSYNTKIDLDVTSFIPQRQFITTFEIDEHMKSHKEEKTTLVARGAKLEIKIDDRAAKWRKVAKGFSIQCYCRNRECEARNRNIVANLGFGVFSSETLRARVVCPVCGECCEEILTAGFYLAGWKFRGSLPEGEVVGEEKTWQNYYVWREFLCEWTRLKFCVWPNQK